MWRKRLRNPTSLIESNPIPSLSPCLLPPGLGALRQRAAQAGADGAADSAAQGAVGTPQAKRAGCIGQVRLAAACERVYERPVLPAFVMIWHIG